jgi:acetyl-CoA acetyltransferase
MNRECGSSACAIAIAALEVMMGYAAVVMAGGMEHLNQAPCLAQGVCGGGAEAARYRKDGFHDAFNGFAVPRLSSAIGIALRAKIGIVGLHARNSASVLLRRWAHSTRKSSCLNSLVVRGQ